MTRSNKGWVHGGHVILAIIALGALAGGVWYTGKTLHGALLMRAAQSWPVAQAEVLNCIRDVTHSTHGPTVHIECEYRYSFNGTDYVSERIHIVDMPGLVGSWEDETFYELDRARLAGQTVPCYVDPNWPARAVLLRAANPEHVWFNIWVGFGVFAFGVLMAGICVSGAVNDRRRCQGKRENPQEPWKWYFPPLKNELKPLRIPPVYLWIAAGYFLVPGIPQLLIVLPAVLRGGATFKGYGLTVVGILLPTLCLVGAVISTARYLPVRRSFLRLSNCPVLAGESMSGELVLAPDRQAPPQVSLTLEMNCQNSKGRRTQEAALPMATLEATRRDGSDDSQGAAYPFTIQTEQSWPEFRVGDPKDVIRWYLRVQVGSRLRRPRLTFLIPFFRDRAGKGGVGGDGC
jgi:Protein of unknown function (DUF3592)